MRKYILLLMMVACLGMGGCKTKELSTEEKQKIADIKTEITKIESEIAATEKTLSSKNTSGLIPTMQSARIEIDKLTLSVLRQHVAAIESGARVTVSISAFSPDSNLLASIESEIKTADAELNKTKAESSLYSGGVIKTAIDARAAMQELALTALKQKHLAAKYGLNIPHGASQPREVAPAPQEKSNPETVKELEVNDPGPFDFRRTRWGMTREEVTQRETSKPIRTDVGSVIYKDVLLGHDVFVLYEFFDGKLYSASYLLNDDQYSNNNNFVDAYRDIVSSLTEKYGKPKENENHWSQNLYKGDYERRGMAYAAGHRTSRAKWEKDGTTIQSIITGNKFKITCGVRYESEELSKKANEEKKKKQSSNL